MRVASYDDDAPLLCWCKKQKEQKKRAPGSTKSLNQTHTGTIMFHENTTVLSILCAIRDKEAVAGWDHLFKTLEDILMSLRGLL
jgi:hypothetical protein